MSGCVVSTCPFCHHTHTSVSSTSHSSASELRLQHLHRRRPPLQRGSRPRSLRSRNVQNSSTQVAQASGSHRARSRSRREGRRRVCRSFLCARAGGRSYGQYGSRSQSLSPVGGGSAIVVSVLDDSLSRCPSLQSSTFYRLEGKLKTKKKRPRVGA
jgi:hypothetical protein